MQHRVIRPLSRSRRRLWLVPALLFAIPACLLAAAARGGRAGLVDEGGEGAGGSIGAPAVALELPTGIDPYIYRPSGELADPVNLIFLHTDAATVAAAAERVLGWRPVIASGMSFKQRGGLRPTSRQLATELDARTRYHMRIQSVPITDTQTYVLASVHRDDTAACGHVGRAFDEMRDLVTRSFAEAGYPVRVVELQNTTPGLHCDGSRVGGDGKAALIDLSTVPRVDIPARNRVPGVY